MNSGIRLVMITLLIVIIILSMSSIYIKNKNILFYWVLALVIISFIFVVAISNRIYEKYLEDDPMLTELRKELRTVFPEVDNIILLKGDKSYTINKKYVHLCLKDEKGDYYHKNMLKYVAIHELAHVKCKEIGHTPEFHRIFEQLLRKAIDAGVYDDKIPTIKNYCEY